MRSWLIACVLAVAALFAAPAMAQQSEEFETQVRGYLDSGMQVHAARGYRQDTSNRDMIAPLTVRGGQIYQVNLRRGQNYRIYGACDNDCSDLDMEIYDANGAFVESDVALDDTPFVQITPTSSGRHYVRFWLAACSAEPCYSGVRVVVGGTPEERVAESGGDYSAGVASLMDQAATAFASEGFVPIPGAAPAGVEPLALSGVGQRVSYQLRAGQAYRFIAACDSDCTDVDIEVLDSAGTSLANNIGVDNPTTVDYTPARNGEFTVRSWLAACSAEPCFAGQRGYVRGR